MDQAFHQVITACSEPRKNQPDTWLSQEMIDAYLQLHEQGYAHSVESWINGKLVGGLYGIALGKAFFGESMFSRITDASKVAFVHLVHRLAEMDFSLIDCQVYTEHLKSLGAELIPRKEFLLQLDNAIQSESQTLQWAHPPEEIHS